MLIQVQMQETSLKRPQSKLSFIKVELTNDCRAYEILSDESKKETYD